MSKEIRDYLVLALPRPVIGPENLRHLLNQSNTDRVLVTRVFPRFCWLALIIYEVHWLMEISSFVLIGHSDYFGFGFSTFN